MPIHDQSYRHWEGTFKSHTFRWWIITREGLRIILRRKLFIIFIMTPPIIQFFVFGAIVYGVNVYGSLFNLNIVNAKFFFDFLMRQIFFIVLICIFGGSGLMANDLKNNALKVKSAVFVSYWSNMEILGKRLFGLSGGVANWYWAVPIILGIAGVCMWTMYRRVNGIEIVK